jgi:hypothetical protein
MPPDAPTPRIVLNSRTYLRLRRVQDQRREVVERGWHPTGTVEPAAIMTHEFGHHVMFWLQDCSIDVRAEMLALGDAGSLSRYAQVSFAEAFAEAFTAHLHGDDTAKNDAVTRGALGILEREIARARAEGMP